MKQTATRSILLAMVVFLLSCSNKNPIYDESIDAYGVFQKALKYTKPPKEILVIFGANWCKDCVVLDDVMQQEPLKSYLKKNYTVIKVDVGSDDRNKQLVEWFGNPTKKGIPSIAVVDPKKQIRFQTHSGEFARARDLTANDVLNFLKDRSDAPTVPN